MAMIIVLTASFVVLVTIGVSVAMIANNLDKVSGGINRDKALSNAQQGLERVRGKYFLNNSLFDSCNAGDCIDTNGLTACGACAGLLFGTATNGNRVEVDAITPPTISGGLGDPYLVGSATLLATGYYKNTARQKSINICLNYCSLAGYNCGDNGCGGTCGSCTLPQTCQSGVCTGPATSCSDATIECGDECVEGDTCGGGTIIDSNLNTVAVLGGCEDEAGANCGNQVDVLVRRWDNTGGSYLQTDALDSEDGSNNTTTLQSIEPALDRFDAVRFCEDLSFNGFSNWYLPGSKEGDRMSEANSFGWITNTSEGCYWMSNETDADNANYKQFGFFGICSDGGKGNDYYVRCLRRY